MTAGGDDIISKWISCVHKSAIEAAVTFGVFRAVHVSAASPKGVRETIFEPFDSKTKAQEGKWRQNDSLSGT